MPKFDYATHAYYFITICCKDRKRLFGKIVGAAYMPPVHVCLSKTGKVAERNLLELYLKKHTARIYNFVIMPFIVNIFFSFGCQVKRAGGGKYAAPTVPRIMNSYKASVSRDIGFPVWQRSYHDHIIRDHHDFEEIWKYIANNPTQWVLDGKA